MSYIESLGSVSWGLRGEQALAPVLGGSQPGDSANPFPLPGLSMRGVDEILYLCRELCVLGRERVDINPRRILLAFCFQHESISKGPAGALTWVVSLHPAGE